MIENVSFLIKLADKYYVKRVGEYCKQTNKNKIKHVFVGFTWNTKYSWCFRIKKHEEPKRRFNISRFNIRNLPILVARCTNQQRRSWKVQYKLTSHCMKILYDVSSTPVLSLQEAMLNKLTLNKVNLFSQVFCWRWAFK